MPTFSKTSMDRLNTCHSRIVRVMELAIIRYDFSVIEGARSKEKQDEYFASGASKVRFPNSYHNPLPEFNNKSLAVDIVPYPIDWNDLHKFMELSKVIKQCCFELLEDKLVWGYDKWQWDMPHWQLEIR